MIIFEKIKKGNFCERNKEIHASFGYNSGAAGAANENRAERRCDVGVRREHASNR